MARNVGEWPPVTATRAPADYVEDDPGEGESAARRRGVRGTVELAEVMPSGRRRWKNYSLHFVDFTISGPIVIADCNFSYSRLKIRGVGSVEFRDCNLTNARWRVFEAGTTLTFVRCNTAGSQAE